MLTVGKLIQSVLPDGTNNDEFISQLRANPNLVKDAPSGVDVEWVTPPFMPTDAFAVAGQMCKVGGIIPFFDPSPYSKCPNSNFCIDVKTRKKADKAGEQWRDDKAKGVPPDFVFDQWRILLEAWNEPITPGHYLRADGDAAPPDWWRSVLLLVMVSDMACARLLRDPVRKSMPNSVKKRKAAPTFFESHVRALYRREVDPHDKLPRPPASLTLMADTGVVCVLPKVRIAPVGATLRNVSRNLSLLPGRGEVRCYWDLSMKVPPSEDHETLDILLIPAPFDLRAKDFEANGDVDVDVQELRRTKKNWEYFHLHQSWIDDKDSSKRIKVRNDFKEICKSLLRNSLNESRCVNGVILPEYALDYDLFEDLCDEMKLVEPNLEFVVCGSSSNATGKSGNIVLTRVWHDQSDATLHTTNSRFKHHRWRMNRSQVETYAISAALNPKIPNWWESTPLGQRELHFQRFRDASVFSVLICEELARSDPCHDILRSVAPNLIFALLLDGPQIRQRWPAQYASNLADDPGSAVLTFTSYGLIKRSNIQGHFPTNHSIAMWRDDTGRVVEIPMPGKGGPAGVLLSLWSEHVLDMAMTGKQSRARAWRYASHFPVFTDKGDLL